MGARFESEFVYIIDKNNTPHYVMTHYFANYGDSYRSDIYLENKRYCVLDLYLTGEVEKEGDFLPYPRENEWRAFLPKGPSEDVSTILGEAELTDVSVSKVVFVRILSGSHGILEYDGFVSTEEGVQDIDSGIWKQVRSFAKAKSNSPAEQEYAIVDRIVELVQDGDFAATELD